MMRGLNGLVQSKGVVLAVLLLGSVPADAGPAKAPSGVEGVVNINQATAPQLQLLPGIGPAKAQRIIAYRTKRKFRTPYELTRVRGVGRRTFARLKPHLAIKGPTTLTRRPPAKR